ncbi:NADH-quinone oxidoreductase subunit N [Deinococcus peraridilitoris]|uniref:NADH-quinone oxidoreductase subunit N n=1 Tax=Deinococcus peraridilitoris (strain DSM 19664 / LMG 22246 / CIP 109416 / KR-200) TaxID=937777 RepID=L0A5Q9_DEIPD|nr:NADH-quinone oxidoreductase subunit N [Deinococcus peraridilitoris]AFZ68779.1 proton-translocating NADH-quinone oxidoreductase, chain N [Deinococcus peraridilitoris DSM 19664]
MTAPLTPPDIALAPLLPILIPLLGAIVATIAFKSPRRITTIVSLVALVLSGFSMLTLWGANSTAFAGALRADNAALAFGLVILVGSIITLLITLDHAVRTQLSFPEFDAMLLYAVTGTLLIAFAGDLIVLLIGLEVMSLAGYVLATLRGNHSAEESGLKYFLLGSIGSAILIYGIALTFGATGTLNLAAIAASVNGGQLANTGLLIAGALMMLAGFGFKVALAPFHQWTPDVYGGAPTIVTLFLSTVVKVAAFAGMIRVFGGALPGLEAWSGVAEVLIAATLVIGNLAALVQTNFKRLLAYSAVAHTGFLALALLAEPAQGGAALVYYLLIYTLMTAGALAVLTLLQPSERGVRIEDLRGLYYRSPVLALLLAACLASLAGLPPFAGFFGKYLVFQAAFQNGHVMVTVLAALMSVVALVYYLRPAALMFAPQGEVAPGAASARAGRFTNATLTVCVVAIVLLGILPGLVYGWVSGQPMWILASAGG